MQLNSIRNCKKKTKTKTKQKTKNKKAFLVEKNRGLQLNQAKLL